ncbi:MAG: HK97 family phage prohead protease [Treponema sp.]|nr:HK97 family phage prohead protease [Treponema sp.]
MDIEKLIKRIQNGQQYRNMELRAISDKDDKKEYRVSGYSTMFNQPFVLYRDKWDGQEIEVREQVDSHAFDEADMSDVIFNLNHEGRVFARLSNNTLKLNIEEKGLHVDAYLGGTEEGRKIHEEIEGGYLTKMSYRFSVEDDKWEEFTEGDKRVYLRTITKMRKLYDVSVVSIPADDHTSISARSVFDGVIEKLQAERLSAEKKEETERQAVLEAEARKRELELLANS